MADNGALESLFLLEVLVDSVKFTKPSGNNMKETCVRFEFLHFPPVSICDEDFSMNSAGYDPVDVPFNGGKSCLFSLPGSFKTMSLNLRITVLRTDESGKRVVMGATSVPLGGSFMTLFQASEKQVLGDAISKTLRNSFTFTDSQGISKGTVSIFVRLSCFGKVIVTQFNVKGADEFLFSNEKAQLQDASSRGGRSGKSGKICQDNSVYSYKQRPMKSGLAPFQSFTQFSKMAEDYCEWQPETQGLYGKKGQPKQLRKTKSGISVSKNQHGNQNVMRSASATKSPGKCKPIINLCECNVPLPAKLVECLKKLTKPPEKPPKKKNNNAILITCGHPNCNTSKLKTDKYICKPIARGYNDLTAPGTCTYAANETGFKTCPRNRRAWNVPTYEVSNNRRSQSQKVQLTKSDRYPSADIKNDTFVLNLAKTDKTGRPAKLNLTFKVPKYFDVCANPNETQYLVSDVLDKKSKQKGKGKKKKKRGKKKRSQTTKGKKKRKKATSKKQRKK